MPKKRIKFKINNEVKNKPSPSLLLEELSSSKSLNKQKLQNSLDEIYDMMVDDNNKSDTNISSPYQKKPNSKNEDPYEKDNVVTERNHLQQNHNKDDTTRRKSNFFELNGPLEDFDVKSLELKYQFENMEEKISHLSEQIHSKNMIINLLRDEKEALSKKLQISEEKQHRIQELEDQYKLIQEENVRIKKAFDDLLDNKKKLETNNDQLHNKLKSMQILEEKNRILKLNYTTEWEKKMEELKEDLHTKITELSRYCLDHYHSSRKNFFSGYLKECSSTIEVLSTVNSWLLDKTADSQSYIDLSKWKERLKMLQETLRDIENQHSETIRKFESDLSLIEDSFLKNQKMPEVSILDEKPGDVVHRALTKFYEIQCTKKVLQDQPKSSSPSDSNAQSRGQPLASKTPTVSIAQTAKPVTQSRSSTASSTAPTLGRKSSTTSSSASSIASTSKVEKAVQMATKSKTASSYPLNMKYYVVLNGYHPGIYHTLDEYQNEITGYLNSCAKVFHEWEDARQFMRQYDRLRWDSVLRGSKGGYEHDIHGRVIVWIAGFYSDSSYGRKAGIGVWFGRRHPRNESEPVDGYASINDAEIQAATVAIRQAYDSKISALVLRTDSKYLMETVSVYLRTWKNNQWLRTNGEPLANEASLRELDRARSLLLYNVYWEWGHAPDEEGIEGAYDLAESGADYYIDSDDSSDSYYDDDNDYYY